MLLDKWREENPQKIFESEDESKKRILKSHNLEKILKELGQMGNFKFPQLKTLHQDYAGSDAYHQLYRYCIKLPLQEQAKEKQLEETLNNIACWIEEGR